MVPLRGRGLSPGRLGALGLVAGLVIVLDQLSKSLAVRHLSSGPRHVWGPLNLELAYNRGTAFSLGSTLSPYIVVLAVLVVLGVLVYTTTLRTLPAALGAGLVLGGALSNLGDRLFRGNGGAVIDWLHLSHWPTFNLADSAVVAGVGLLLLSNLGPRRSRPPTGPTATARPTQETPTVRRDP